MRRAFSLLGSSKIVGKKSQSKSDETSIAKVEEPPPSYTASADASKSKLHEGNVKIKQPKGLGCALVTKIKSKAGDEEAADGSGLSSRDTLRFPVFAFGPNGYFLSVPNTTGNRAQSYAVYAPVDSFMMTKRDDFSELYWYAFTPYSDEIIAYKDKSSGLVLWTFFKNNKRPANAPTYSSLMRWLRDNVAHEANALRESRVVFGPNGSYFARSAKACTWHDIPDALQDRIDKLFPDVDPSDRPIPDFVALGIGGAHVIWPPSVGEENRITTTLPEDHLLRKGRTSIAHLDGLDWVSLSIDHKDSCFHSNRNGEVTLFVNQLPHTSALNVLGQAVRWIQAKADFDNSTFEVALIV